jgi:release factor glutamine methyltransferase
MRPDPYLASEDSALLRRELQPYAGKACLEIGAGNGGNLVALAKSFKIAVGTDVERPGMTDWSTAGGDFVLCDRASCFRNGTFDLVAFNPPYLRSDGIDDRAIDGGKEGQVPLAFMREALRVVKDSGRILMLLTDGNPVDRFEEECRQRGFELVRSAGKHMFYEELSVYEARRAAGVPPGGYVATGDREIEWRPGAPLRILGKAMRPSYSQR